jgi:hypothetical protein
VAGDNNAASSELGGIETPLVTDETAVIGTRVSWCLSLSIGADTDDDGLVVSKEVAEEEDDDAEEASVMRNGRNNADTMVASNDTPDIR